METTFLALLTVGLSWPDAETLKGYGQQKMNPPGKRLPIRPASKNHGKKRVKIGRRS
jgi:hypothetical protein